jgi:hypothetical protein
MIKFFIIPFFFFAVASSAVAQGPLTPQQSGELKRYEDSLKAMADSMMDSRDEMVRQGACYGFIKMLVRALKTPNSFYYPFDSLTRISILQPEDARFRIMTWGLRYDNGTYRYYGAIQMHDRQELKLFPLFDYSPFIQKPADTLTSADRWIGAIYYRLIPSKTSAGKTYYTLFGWQGNTSSSNIKLIEFLSFNSKGQPVFGAALFDFGARDPRNKWKRYMIEYKEDAETTLNYDHDLSMIITDHLQPTSESTIGERSTYVPDGSYEGFKWENNKWRYVENVFTSTQAEPPFPDPVDFEKEHKANHPKR